jgi:hypothetical protein
LANTCSSLCQQKPLERHKTFKNADTGIKYHHHFMSNDTVFPTLGYFGEQSLGDGASFSSSNKIFHMIPDKPQQTV